MKQVTVSPAERELIRNMVALIPERILDLVSHGCTGCVGSRTGELLLRLGGVTPADHVEMLAAKVRREQA